MNTKEIKKRIAQDNDLTQDKAGSILNTLMALIKQELQAGNSVNLSGVGKLYVTSYSRKQIITPQGKKMEVKPHNVVRFRPSQHLKKSIAGKKDI